MSKTVSKVLFLGAIAAAGYWLLNKFSANISVDWAGIKWLGMDGLKLRFALKYRLGNQNDAPLTVANFKGKLYYGQYALNDVVINQPVTVNPGGSEDMQVNFSVNPGALLAEILQFIDSGGGFKKFILKGTMTGRIGDVPWIYPVNEKLQLAE